MIIAGTGHRPDKLGGFGDDVMYRLYTLATDALALSEPDRVISGMALGWDMALAHAAVHLQIPLTLAIPFRGQECRWTPAQQQQYRKMLAYVALSPGGIVHYVSDPGYAAQKMQIRNEWMVDHATRVLALWNGDTVGGTWNCVRYARQREVPIQNLWDEYTGRNRVTYG